MHITRYFFDAFRLLVGHANRIILGLCFASAAAYAQQPVQEPLLARTQSVRPNLSLMFDDSLSMRFTCNYTSNVNNRVATTYGGIGNSVGCRNSGTFASTATAVMSAGNPIYISPVNNELAYDPRKLYRPPFTTPTTRATAAAVATHFPFAANVVAFQAVANPNASNIVPTAFIGPTENFTAVPPVAEPTGAWQLVHIPLATFNAATANLAGLENLANYDSIAVGTTQFLYRAANLARYTARGTVNPLPKPVARTDCVLNAAYCTVAEERQNIANWHLYYRDRLRAFRVGVAEAFSGLPDTFRFNYSTLGTALYTGVFPAQLARASTDFSGISTMRNYADENATFYSWLFADVGAGFNTIANGGTPLRQAYDHLGRYYQNNISNSGPWGSTPWAANTETPEQHLSCRKSFAILATDGQWNNGASNSVTFAPLVGVPASINGIDRDGITGPSIGDHPRNITYQYVPNASHPWSVGKQDRPASNSGYAATLADVAMHYWVNDLREGSANLVNNVSDGTNRNGPFWQHLNLTTVGFGVNGTLNASQLAEARASTRDWPLVTPNSPSAIDDLAHAAHNGGGDFLAVSDAQTFANRLRDKLLAISSEELSQAGVVGSTQALTAGSLKIEATYVSGKWWGNVSAVELNASNAREAGTKWRVVELTADGLPNGTTTIPTPTTREVYTYVDSTTAPIPFNHTNLVSNLMIGTGTAQLTSTWSAAQTDFIRGVRTQEGDGRPFRERTSIMGDIVNSTPAFVKDTTPDRYSTWGTAAQQLAYTAFKTAKSARPNGLVMVGANDGMLHAFREQDGNEIFAYIPRAVLSHLHLLTEKNYAVNHRYYVDGPLNEVDAYISTPNGSGFKSTRWSNLVLGTTGAGAKSVFAIDTTEVGNLRNDDILWEINTRNSSFSSDLGFITQRVQAGVTASGDWVAIFGNGIGSTSGLAKLFVVNLETGALIKTINTDSETANGLGGVRLVRDNTGQVLGAYAGDNKGRMWRFDLSASSQSSWPNDGQLLFAAPSTTADGTTTAVIPSISAQPAVFGRDDGRAGYIVTFGTGRLQYSADTNTPHPLQRAYGIWDTAPFGGTETFRTAAYANLVNSVISVTTSVGDVTGTTFYSVAPSRGFDWGNDHGWRLDMSLSDGQRIIYPVEPLNGLVQLQTVAPRAVSVNACTNDGQARGFNLFIDPLRGGCRAGQTLDTNQDNQISSTDSGACGASTFGDGTNATFGSVKPRDFEKVCLTCTPPPCENPNFYSIDTTAGAQLIQTCDPIPPSIGGGSFKRTVRQVFIRK